MRESSVGGETLGTGVQGPHTEIHRHKGRGVVRKLGEQEHTAPQQCSDKKQLKMYLVLADTEN